MVESSAIPPTLPSAIRETDKTVAFSHSLLDITARVAHSVTLHSTTAVNDSRTVSLLREQSTGQHLLYLSRTQVAKTISAAQERRRSGTCTLERIGGLELCSWYASVPRGSRGTPVLGGKVLVLDAALIPEPTLRVSYAALAEGRDSPSMDAFFS
ncbi:hypothetical protein H4582DRAFT_2087050 [Lactarius indigo]|nr:hypothetical protein H4582DRAFT_2087050 [Lactarius indigo]